MFVRAPNPIWFFNNLTGQVLDDTYWAFFLTNTLPYLPQAVYQDPNGNVLWVDPIEFQPSGGLPNNLYFDPTLVYRIEIRQGPTQADPLIWLIENFVPGEGNAATNNNFANSSNLIANPQFSDINFSSPLTITTAGTYNVAPGWQLILTGTGTTTSILTQLNLPGEDQLPGNPPYALEIANSGWATAQLVQKFSSNGALFAGGSVSMSLLANPSTVPQLITLNYVVSNATTPPTTILIAASELPAGIWTILSGINNIPPSTNPDLGTTAYTEMQIILQPTGTISLTNAQMIGQSATVPNPTTVAGPAFQEQSLESQTNNEFYIYKPQLFYKPIPNYLVGWDFSLNPVQFVPIPLGSGGSPITAPANTSFYAWDQTIVFNSIANSLWISRDVAGSMTINNTIVNNQVAIVQYLDQERARKILNQHMAVNLTSIVGLGIKVTISLWYTTDASLPNQSAGTSLISTLDANGKPAAPLNGNWIEVPRRNGQDATLIGLGISNHDFFDYNFNGWELPNTNSSNTATFFAIVIGTGPQPVTSWDINSVNLVNGDIATRPSPQTADEVLRECARYYAKTFPQGVYPQVNAGLPGSLGYWAYASGTVEQNGIFWQFPSTMRVTPTVVYYSPLVANANWYNNNVSAASGPVSLVTVCNKSIAIRNDPVAGDNKGNFICIQMTADARLGVV